VRWPATNPQRRLGVAYTDRSVIITFEFAPTHRVTRVFIRPRQAFAQDVWSVELPETSRGVVSIELPELLERFESAWSDGARSGSGVEAADPPEDAERVPTPPLYADLGFTLTNIEPRAEDPVGPTDVRAAGFARAQVQASRAIQAKGGAFLTAYLTGGGGLSFLFGENQPLPKGVCSVRWVQIEPLGRPVVPEV